MTFESLIVFFLVALGVAVVTLFATGRGHIVPSVSVSLGILFTFVGITTALIGFDVSDIQGSIPQLLDGMRLAFITSIIGMGFGILVRLFLPIAGSRKQAEGVTIDTLAYHLGEIRRALIGEGEATLHTQLGKLRLAFIEKQDTVISGQQKMVALQERMVTELREFAETVIENNIDALVEALEEVMRDFNAKINEQLGENFAKFNEGIGRMMDWQQTHKEQLSEMIDHLWATLAAVKASEQALQTIEERSRRFAETADRLHAVLETAHEEVEALEDELETFAEISEQAKEALPRIESTLDDLTTGFSDKVKEATTEISRAAEEQRVAVNELVAAIREEHSELGKTIEGVARDTSEQIANQFEVLDKELGEELEKALSTLGSQLTSLSKKFVDDYTPLTAQLQRLVEVSRSVDGQGSRNNGGDA